MIAIETEITRPRPLPRKNLSRRERSALPQIERDLTQKGIPWLSDQQVTEGKWKKFCKARDGFMRPVESRRPIWWLVIPSCFFGFIVFCLIDIITKAPMSVWIGASVFLFALAVCTIIGIYGRKVMTEERVAGKFSPSWETLWWHNFQYRHRQMIPSEIRTFTERVGELFPSPDYSLYAHFISDVGGYLELRSHHIYPNEKPSESRFLIGW